MGTQFVSERLPWPFASSMASGKRKLFILIASTLGLLVGVSQVPAATLYSQPWDGTGNGFGSQNETSIGNFATAYDNFTLGSSAIITQIDFTGAYYSGTDNAITGFTVQFWANSSGQPGASLYSVHILGSGGETFTGPGSTINQAYSYSLPVNFAANGATTYWLSIVPDLAFNDQNDPSIIFDPWLWATGAPGDTSFYQDLYGTRYLQDGDLAFTLLGGGVVPLPAALPLFATGLGALGLMGWRRNRKATAVA